MILRLTGVALSLLALAGCGRESGTGYVEIKTAPGLGRPVALYMDADKVEPGRGGTTVLRQPVGTAKLQVDADGNKVTLCQVVVRKNRITTLTVSTSTLDRYPRCTCGRAGTGDPRMCIG